MIKTMGERLREARVAKGIVKAEEAAERLNMRASTYRAHENGQNEFGPEWAERYGRLFGVSAAYLLTGETNGARPLQDSEVAIRNIRKLWDLLGAAIRLDPEDQGQIIETMEPQIKALSRRPKQRTRSASGG